MIDQALHDLAYAAGIEVTWRDVEGRSKAVADDSLRAVLAAIGFPAETSSQISDSHAMLNRTVECELPPLITANVGEPIHICGLPVPFQLVLESGAVVEGTAAQTPDGVLLPPIFEPGYHHLDLGASRTIVAVAPPRAYTLDDAAAGAKMWGLAVQLYALRRHGDGGVGDFTALADLAKEAAVHGADAIAISPVHAQFSSDLTRFGPYAPSNRAAFNVLHIAEPIALQDTAHLVDWPAVGAAKMAALRTSFSHFQDHSTLAAFRKTAGAGLNRHALFEAIQASLIAEQSDAHDWRLWPAEFRDPTSAAVSRFLEKNAEEVDFHAYLQFRADQGLQAAQQIARDCGMKIGLIADLAVGTDHAGSHSWSRQDEVLRGLEIGAPPDAINREGQSWGITAFSPHGLRKSGFSGFIEMLRHALRHAGGVRIDHVMGLARLWVIPHGCRSADGAYIRLPVQDLLRLVILESYRRKAVILGEDLGTLPDGFQSRIDGAGIAGLRVMWFERAGAKFAPPQSWTRTAVAMTSTHDLPTVAGWWQGTDIEWRRSLGMAGDGADQRNADRAELWNAFLESGATSAPIPSPDDGAAAADAACAHLGLAASTLALLPIEDALGLPDQPNLPGTIDEHPNWRRRLPLPVNEMLRQPDVAARLAAIQNARSQA